MSQKELTIHEVMVAPWSSFWLQMSLKSAIQRDPVDAMHDAHMLYLLLKKRADHILGGDYND